MVQMFVPINWKEVNILCQSYIVITKKHLLKAFNDNDLMSCIRQLKGDAYVLVKLDESNDVNCSTWRVKEVYKVEQVMSCIL